MWIIITLQTFLRWLLSCLAFSHICDDVSSLIFISFVLTSLRGKKFFLIFYSCDSNWKPNLFCAQEKAAQTFLKQKRSQMRNISQSEKRENPPNSKRQSKTFNISLLVTTLMLFLFFISRARIFVHFSVQMNSRDGKTRVFNENFFLHKSHPHAKIFLSWCVILEETLMQELVGNLFEIRQTA